MIISCGEALIDFFREEQSHSFNPVIGGSPLNVAVALANAGSKSALMTNLSTDQFGEMHLAHLANASVSLDYLTRSDHSSGLMFVAYNSDKSANYSFYGHDTAELNFDYQRLNTPLDNQVNCLHFGSFSLVCGKTAQSFDQLINSQHSTCVISADINIREMIEPDIKVWEEKFQQLMQKAHILKASSEDLCLLYALDTFNAEHALNILKQWSQTGVSAAVITDAQNGAYALFQGELIHLPALSVQVVDTVGAGDCFMAFFLNQLERSGVLSIDRINNMTRSELELALSAGLKAAAFTVEQQGAIFPKL